MQLHVTLLILVTGAVACTTAKTRIVPGEGGVNEIVATDYEREDAANAAVEEAEDYCEKRGKSAVFVKDEGTAYQGKVDEETNAGLKSAGRVGDALGIGAAGALGGSMSSNEDYKAKMQFKCQ